MPQHTQPCLIHVLLLWTTLLSIIQVVFIIFYFTAGPFQSSSAVTSEHTMQFQANNTPSPLPENELLLGKGKMLTYETTSYENHRIKWLAKNADTRLMSEEGEVLIMKKDGYYFLNLQVTLCSCEVEHMVSLNWNSKLLLQGWITTKSRGTGSFSKVAELSAGGSLQVTMDPKPACINTTESETHLDIIYMVKP